MIGRMAYEVTTGLAVIASVVVVGMAGGVAATYGVSWVIAKALGA
ncbi:MAG: hypothetical protein ACRC8D_07205 [Aeromonas sp.]